MINKKASQMPTENIVFLVLNIFFFCALLFFVLRTASNTAIVEEVYAKKLALIVDQMQPNSEMNVSVKGLYETMDANKFEEFPIRVSGNIITVSAAKNSGSSFRFFSAVTPVFSIDSKDSNKILNIKT
jgi:hypothetical protein